MGHRTERDLIASEWFNVFRDDRLIGCFGRVEELGIVEWVAFDASNRRLGVFRGRGCRAKAQAAVLAQITEVERVLGGPRGA
jgi:hypothetical protein